MNNPNGSIGREDSKIMFSQLKQKSCSSTQTLFCGTDCIVFEEKILSAREDDRAIAPAGCAMDQRYQLKLIK